MLWLRCIPASHDTEFLGNFQVTIDQNFEKKKINKTFCLIVSKDQIKAVVNCVPNTLNFAYLRIAFKLVMKNTPKLAKKTKRYTSQFSLKYYIRKYWAVIKELRGPKPFGKWSTYCILFIWKLYMSMSFRFKWHALYLFFMRELAAFSLWHAEGFINLFSLL